MKNPCPIAVVGALLLGLAAYPDQSLARVVTNQLDDLAELSLEELANLEISSVSKKPESLATAAASIFVITADDIRRMGVTSLPETLRLAPNLQVARTDAGSWAISARGFNISTANKLLVLIDGRPVYTPLFSGVFWDMQDLFMADIARIEVISGPNATTWGSNAVNGVINVVTTNAKETIGGLATVSAGDQEQAYGVRVGDSTDGGVHYRIYGKYFSADATEAENGAMRDDAFDRAQAGFRLDTDLDSGSLTVQGDVYSGALEQPSTDTPGFDGANLLARWNHSLGDTSSISLQGFYDHVDREFGGGLVEHLNIIGVEFNHQFQPAQDHVMVWGIDTRHARDKVTNTPQLAFLPARKELSWTSVFAQDDIRMTDNLHITFGARIEDNSYTGVEFMPDARIAWTPVSGHTIWSALSRAVRTPSRIDREFFIPGQPPYQLTGDPDFKSEVANVFELGYRAQPTDMLSWSLTAFYADYDRLRSLEDDGGTQVIQNKLQGNSSGVEGWLSWQPSPSWRLGGGFLLLDKDLELRPDSTATSNTEGNDPSAQWQLRSSWDLSEQVAFEAFVRHVNALPDPAVPAYTLVDTRLAWRTTDELEIALSVQNLLDDEHVEFDDPGDRSEFGRYVFLQLRWSFL